MEVGNPSFLYLGSTRKIDVIDGLCYETDDMLSIGDILLSRLYRSSFCSGRKSVGVCCRCRS
jgi:hypothetical protein